MKNEYIVETLQIISRVLSSLRNLVTLPNGSRRIKIYKASGLDYVVGYEDSIHGGLATRALNPWRLSYWTCNFTLTDIVFENNKNLITSYPRELFSRLDSTYD